MSTADGAASLSAWQLGAIFRWIGWCGLILTGMTAVLGDFLARAPANAQGNGIPLSPPSPAFPFGTDDLGRDVYGEVIHAVGVTFGHAASATFITVVFGSLLGFAAARAPRGVGIFVRFAVRISESLPPLLIAILLVGLTTKAMAPVAAGIAAAPFAFARAYGRVRRTDHSAHTDFAIVTGISPAALLRRDLSYEFRDNFVEAVARAIAAVTITLSTASFLGFGAEPPHRDLGLMIGAARPLLFQAWWAAAFPALALTIIILFARLAAGLEEGERP